jgi:hypothetical protein
MSNTQSNAGAARAAFPKVVIKRAYGTANTPCAICGEYLNATDAPPELYLDAPLELHLEGTDKHACFQCGRKYAPEVTAGLELMRKAELAVERRRQAQKKALLAHYAERQPKPFIQFDGWLDADEVMGRDADGQGVTGSYTWELMNASDVRVLIPKATTREQALVLLRKIAGWIERGGLADMTRPAHPLLSPCACAFDDEIPF